MGEGFLLLENFSHRATLDSEDPFGRLDQRERGLPHFCYRWRIFLAFLPSCRSEPCRSPCDYPPGNFVCAARLPYALWFGLTSESGAGGDSIETGRCPSLWRPPRFRAVNRDR